MLNNNDIMKKLRVALSLRDTDIIDILKLAQFEISSSELSAIFRKEDHPQFTLCGDQILRRFLDGLIIRNRGVRAHVPPVKEGAPSARMHRVIRKDRSRPPERPDNIRVYRAES